MINPVNWSQIKNYSQKDFNFPMELDRSVVEALDGLATILPIKPIPIDDVRHTKTGSQHELGRAVDFTVPGMDSLKVLQAMRESQLFSGIGFYTNENNVQSFHGDTRLDRSVANPAIWGAWKDRTRGITDWVYTGIDEIINLVKKKGINYIPWIVAAILVYMIVKK